MAKRKKNLPFYEKVEITGAGTDGRAVARVNDMVIFVKDAVPGDLADLQVYRKKRNYSEARVVRFHSLSEKRAEPVCAHFGVCGGCKWQNMSYEQQLFYKQEQVRDSLTRIGKIDIPGIMPILGSAHTTMYRNKLEYTFSDRRWLTDEEVRSDNPPEDMNALGFHVPGRFDRVLDIEKCYLQKEPSNSIRVLVKKYALEKGLEFFDLRAQKGFLRNLIIRTSSTGEVMVILSLFREDREEREKLLDHIFENIPGITSLMFVINQKANDTIADQDIILYRGRDHITEEMEGLTFRIGPKSFYQTNSDQALELYRIAREFAAPGPDDIIYDLYTGTGTIACFIARHCRKVVGIEFVPEAINDANANASFNSISNVEFHAGDIKDLLDSSFIEAHGAPDTIILDPPRAGLHPDVIEGVLLAGPGKIVYVSCNPATQARDLALFDRDYTVEAVQPVDMFPHTHHVENVVLLKKRH